jgi:hypothetical protein
VTRKTKTTTKAKTGPDAERVKIVGDWERAIGAVLKKKPAKKKPKKKPA